MKTNLLLSVAVIALASFGCTDQETKERAVAAAHRSSNCPTELRGQVFEGEKLDTTKFIEIVDEGDNKLAVNFSGVEVATLDGRKRGQANGAVLTASCVSSGEIKIAGATRSGRTMVLSLSKADDGGLNLSMSEPDDIDVHYKKLGPATSSFDKIISLLSIDAIDENTTGIPTSKNLK